MELETEIPIWFNGRVKWISNLSSRSRCSDVIEAILSSSSLDKRLSEGNEEYLLYECWRGVERTLKSRCRLLKLWKSWGGESENVILTVRSLQEENFPRHIIIRQQEKKLNKLKEKMKRIDQQIEEFNLNKTKDPMITYLNLTRSINNLNNQIENEEKLIFNLTKKIENENKKDLKDILFDVNQTLIYSRKLNQLSDQFDQQIDQINKDIQNKEILLDQLELDFGLEDNIDIDSLDDQDQISFKFNSPSSQNKMIQIKTSSVQNRPTAIVEPSLSKLKSKEYLSKRKRSNLLLNQIYLKESLLNKPKIKFTSFSISKNSNNNDESDTGISSTNSNDEQLITLV